MINNATRRATNISNRLYLTMQDDSLNVIDRISIRIINGVGWAQIPIRKIQYAEGYYTLWAHTTWMQNFRSFYSRRFYFSPAATDAWLVTSETKIDSTDHKTRLSISLSLDRTDRSSSPVALKDVEVKIYDRDRYLFRKEMRTGVDGSLKFTETIANRVDGKRLKAQITSLDPIDTNKVIQVPLTIDRGAKIDLQFLPEGGKLVAGLKSVVGFKAIGDDGRGANVAGDVFDSGGKKVASFRSLHNGMGTFEFTPQADPNAEKKGLISSITSRKKEAYTAKVTEPAGVTEEFPLPKIEPFGTVIHIDNPETANLIKITFAGLTSIPLDSTLTVVGTAGGRLCYAQKINFETREVMVDKRAFPTGLVRFTLFKGISALNERVIFVDHQDQLQMKITPNSLRYGKRDSVNVTIEVKDKNGYPVAGRFSLSVTDDVQAKPDTIGDLNASTGLLLTGNLKIGVKDETGDQMLDGSLLSADDTRIRLDTAGSRNAKSLLTAKNGKGSMLLKDFGDHLINGEIESPGYYIHRKEKIAWQALDNLMLTQGWADHSWKTVFDGKKKTPYKAQNDQNITGTVFNLFGKPIANTPVWIYLKQPALDGKEMTDSKGVFTFKSVLQIDTATYFFQALKPNLKPLDFGEVDIDRPKLMTFYPFFNYPILPWYVNADSTMINLAKRQAALANAANPKGPGTNLKEVKIRQKKIIKGSYNEYGAGNADYIFDENDIKRSGLTNLYDFLFRNIPGLRLAAARTADSVPLIGFRFRGTYIVPKMDLDPMVVNDLKASKGSDDRPVDYIEELSKFELSDIKGIELAFSNKYTAGRGSKMAITTISGVGGLKKYSTTSNFYRPVPTTVPKLFYSPKYKIKSPLKVPDYRPTIHWEPNIITDRNGKATLAFYTSDSDGGLTFDLQGVGAAGQVGSLIYSLPNKK